VSFEGAVLEMILETFVGALAAGFDALDFEVAFEAWVGAFEALDGAFEVLGGATEGATEGAFELVPPGWPLPLPAFWTAGSGGCLNVAGPRS